MNHGRAALARAIECKRAGGANTQEQIEALVRGYSAGIISDDEFAPWLHAVLEHGLCDDETAWLTLAMAASGVMLSWSGVCGVVVDKHSTGGVGDEVSLIAVPLAAACGVKVAKLSGRALGHTGGTIDKLEAIPRLRTHLSAAGFKLQVAEVGCAIAQATDEIAPADKKIYALRHRTKTIESVGLITASVLSKKIAGGAPFLVIDVKCGRSAFMQTQRHALELARSIAQVGRRCGRSITVLVTDMDAPLARSIGDALELEEAIAVLSGREGGRLREVALSVAEAMLAVQGGDERGGAPARRAALESALQDGSAYRRFAAMASAQGGDLKAFEKEATALTQSQMMMVEASSSGFVASIDGRVIAEAIAGRRASLDEQAGAFLGVRLRKTVGDAVGNGEPIATVFGDDGLAHAVRQAIEITMHPPAGRPLVIDRIHAEPM